jgi:probable phosphoglycerate mutase
MGLTQPAPLTEATIHLVRHGQSQWNVEHRIQGQRPHIELTELGRAQAERAAQTLSDSGARRVLSSDLVRAVQTAAPIAAALGVEVELVPALRERGMGAVEGLISGEVWAAHPDMDWRDPDQRFPGGESKREVYERFASTLAGLQDGSPVVVVSHGDAIRLALAWLSGQPVAEVGWFDVPNCSVITAKVRAGQVSLNYDDRHDWTRHR